MTEVHDNGNRVKNWTRRVEEEGKIAGGMVTMWLGATFLLREINYIKGSMWWPVFASGLGVLLILRGISVYQNGGYWSETKSHVFGGAFFMFIGLAKYADFTAIWPVILIGSGLAVILGADR